MDRAQIGVLEETDKVRLGRFLEGADGGALEAQIGLEVLGDLTNQSLERQLPDQQLGRLLISSNFSKRHGTRPVAGIANMLYVRARQNVRKIRTIRQIISTNRSYSLHFCSLFCLFFLIPVTMRLFHATGGRRALPGRLRRELLAGSFSSRRLTGRLLGTRHDSTCNRNCRLNTIVRGRDPEAKRNAKKISRGILLKGDYDLHDHIRSSQSHFSPFSQLACR